MKKTIIAAFMAVTMLCEHTVALAAETVKFAAEETEPQEEIEVTASRPNASMGGMTVENGIIKWSISDGILYIYGKNGGEKMEDYLNPEGEDQSNLCPWIGNENIVHEIIIEDSIAEIGNYAFYNFTALEKVTIKGSSLKKIGSYAFANCGNLKEINLLDTVESIGAYAFYNCSQLNTISNDGCKMPSALTSIPEGAFENCTCLNHVILPQGIKEIGANAFEKNYNLEYISIPDGVTTIGENAFKYCLNLKSVYIKDKSTLTTIAENAFSECTSLEEFYVIPESYSVQYAKQISYLEKILKYCTYLSTGNLNYKVSFQNKYVYTGKEIQPVVTVTDKNGNQLKENTDYTVSYSDNINVGNKAKITVTGNNKYYGTIESFFTIEAQCNLAKNAKVSNIEDQIYTGKEIKPEVTITVKGKTLVKDKDYTVSYQNNTNVGNSAKVIITGQGDYTGTTEKTFNICYDIQKAKVKVENKVYTGKKLQPKVTVTYNKKKLVKGKDYKVSYSNNKKIGTKAKVTIQGIGTFAGTVSKTFTIAPQKPKVKVKGKTLKITNYNSKSDVYLQCTFTKKGKKKKATLMYGSGVYNFKKYVKMSKDSSFKNYMKKYKGGTATITVKVKINGIDSASSKKVKMKL